MRFCTLLIILISVGCSVETEVPKMYPSDYLYAQRAFPHGIDHDAYLAAVSAKKSTTSLRSFSNPWQAQGPYNTCGRVTDIEMPYDNMETIFAGSASGGIFKSEDRGNTWRPVFDEALSLSIGDMAIDKTNSDIMYVGTGESNAGGGSLAYDGLGVYRSEDGGESWEAKGLEDAGSIGKVVIDPNDSNRVFVGAMGALFNNDNNGGVYRTEDGGSSWEQILFKSDSTGAIDLAIHPQDGNIIYAAMWERIRRPHNRQYGGTTSGLYKSTDGGDTWEELTSGLPTDENDKGRIGIAISESDPNILYAMYANKIGNLHGIYKTEDGGDTWQAKNINGITNVSYMWWFGKIIINPNNPDDVYVTSITMHRSTDGAETWGEVFNNAHVDHHSLFVHPHNDSLILNGNDGGVNLSDGIDSANSIYLNGMSNFQFYTCEINPHNPDKLLGGSQDKGTNTNNGGDEWSQILGGDGFRVLVDPNDSLRIYAEVSYGNVFASSDGGQNFNLALTGLTGRRNWNCPFVLDPNAPHVLYTGGQRLHRSSDFAATWEPISPILVKEDNPVGNIDFGTLTAIDVSRHTSDVIYIGTDDGNVWVTRDYGITYTDISDGLPERWITAITHDPFYESGVYVTVSGFRFAETASQVLYSDDYGSSWISIGDGLPDIPCNDIVADHVIENLIYVATDIGVYVSENRGDTWAVLGSNLPTVPTLDLDLEDRLLAVATFGRGMYTYDLPTVSTTENINEITFRIYPNPATDFILIESEIAIGVVSIFNVQGQNVKQVYGQSKIDVRDLVSGTYIIRAGDWSRQFIKS